VASASFSICSSATGLGTECSPTVPCTAGRICVDGLCR
jgi:hypothetical protein